MFVPRPGLFNLFAKRTFMSSTYQTLPTVSAFYLSEPQSANTKPVGLRGTNPLHQKQIGLLPEEQHAKPRTRSLVLGKLIYQLD